MKVVVTGAAGYIGSVLCHDLANEGWEVIGFDNMMWNQGLTVSPVFSSEDINRPLLLVEDVTEWSPLLEYHIETADIIIPLAALVGAPLCDQHPTEAIAINQMWISQLVDRLDNQLVIFPNTNSGYGSTGDAICTEETPSNPLSLYAETKQASEDLLTNSYHRAICFRLATVFGYSFRSRLDLLVNNLTVEAYENNCLMIFDGHFRRNYVHVRDVVDAFKVAIEQGLRNDRMTGEVFNLGNDSANCTKKKLARTIAGITGAEVIINDSQTDPDKRDYEVSSQKLYDTVGFEAVRSLEFGIKEILDLCKITTKDDRKKCRNY